MVFSTNIGLVFINLLPFYWFDGGFVLESILWPWTGRYRAIYVTCIVGMVVAVPMFLLSLAGTALMAMIFWALLFFDAFKSAGSWWRAAPARPSRPLRSVRR